MKPAGSEVKLTIDWGGEGDPDLPEPGDVLQTRTGRRYVIASFRRVASSKVPCRLKVVGVVMAEDEGEPDGARVFHLRWWERKRKR